MNTAKTAPAAETDIDLANIDYAAIELEARKMRAEAIRYGTVQAGAWLKGVAQRVFGAKTQAA